MTGMPPVLLASGSPRRRELLTKLGLRFTVCPPPVEEDAVRSRLPKNCPARVLARCLASEKARAVFSENSGAFVLGADTVVALQDEVLGKPADAADAARMLRLLSGKTHEVVTGVALISAQGEETFCARTRVTFFELTDEEIETYVKSGEPIDKAGAYGIQGLGALLVREISGDFYNVVGLPVAQLWRRLRILGVCP